MGGRRRGGGGEVTADSSRDVEHRGRAGPERERDKEITIKRNRQYREENAVIQTKGRKKRIKELHV